MEKIDTRYRIYTEDVNRANILAAASHFFDSFSVGLQTGVWKSKAEPSLYIEVYGSYHDNGSIRALALRIKAENNQEAVLITRENVSADLI